MTVLGPLPTVTPALAPTWRQRWYLPQLLAIALLYGGLARIGFELAPAYYYVTSIWFPSGLGLAILLRFGLRFWPAMWLGPLLFTLSIGVPLSSGLITGAGDMLSSLVGALLLRRVFRIEDLFTRLRAAALFVVFGAVLPPAIGGLVGALTLHLSGVAPAEMVMPIFRTWWLADFAGAILLAPVLLTWPRQWHFEPRQYRELALLGAALLLISFLLLGSSKKMFSGDPLPNYAFAPLVIWAALRFGTAITMLVTLVASFVAILGTELYSVSDDSARALQLLNMQVFNASLAMLGVLLCAALNQLRNTASAYQRSEERFRRTFDYAASGVGVVALDGRFVRVNQALCRMLGYSESELLGKPFLDLTHPDDVAESREARRQLIEGEAAFLHLRKRYLHKDGSVLWTLVNVSILRDDKGNPQEFVTQIQDITQYRQMEQAVEALNASLEQQVQERTAQLAEANRELEAFTWSVSHDMRAPLRAIDGFVVALAEEETSRLSEQGKQYLQRIRSGVERLNTLINAFLELSRLSSDTLKKVDINLSALASEICADLAAVQPDRKVQIDIAPALHVTADPQQMRILLTNLLSNAWKFTGKVSDARIRFYADEQDGQTVYHLQDNGAGFDMAAVDKLFTPFQRLHSQSDFEGTGVGLATCRRIVQRHGGRLTAEATLGNGATFSFTIADTTHQS